MDAKLMPKDTRPHFNNDYNHGMHPRILELFNETDRALTATEPTSGASAQESKFTNTLSATALTYISSRAER